VCAVLLARPFVPITKTRLEGLLASFPKLMGEGKQHTVIETSDVRQTTGSNIQTQTTRSVVTQIEKILYMIHYESAVMPVVLIDVLLFFFSAFHLMCVFRFVMFINQWKIYTC
jgi:hypothetical protein